MSGQPRYFAALALTAALGMLAACSSPNTAPTDPSESIAADDTATQPSETRVPNESPVATDDDTLGPLTSVLQQVGDSENGGDADAIAAQQEAVEKSIQTCMAAEGFEYAIWSPDDGDLVQQAEAGSPTWGTRGYAELYGYGVTTLDATVQAKMAVDERNEEDNPNTRYVDAMTDAEKDAYYRALWGKSYQDYLAGSGDDAEQAASDSSRQGAACAITAWDEHADDSPKSYEDPAFADLNDEVNLFFAELPDDPEIVALDGEWSGCMAQAGYDYARREDPQAALQAEYEAIGGAEAAESDVAQLRDKEITTALADVECVETLDYDSRRRQIEFARQQDFVDAHKADLAAWVETYGAEE